MYVIYRNFNMYPRILNLPNLLKNRSSFLFGPRATGKSCLIRAQFSTDTPVLDLLETKLYLRLKKSPEDLASVIAGKNSHASIVVIDEVQRIPELLNEVHRLIEKDGTLFLLTGSSARKLKRTHANMLGGRARTISLFPLTYAEITDFQLMRYLQYGGLPLVYQSDDPLEDLYGYVENYLKEEIQAEALVRDLSAFSRFLEFSAITSGNLLNFANIANDAQVSANTVREFYTILEDTFIGFMLPAWTKSQKRKAIMRAKFYYFDIGVKNTLSHIKEIPEKSDLFGQTFEHFIALELRAYLSYYRKHEKLQYWQSKNGQEVDFIIGDDIAIEVKATDHTHDKHLQGLRALMEEKICKRYFLVSQDPLSRRVDNIDILHWETFLKMLWSDEISKK